MTGPKRVTPKQLAANRRNAQKSTGPRTARGKAVSRYNALTHGILARAVIPEALDPYESREDFDRLVAALAEAYAPAGPLEELLVQQIAAAYWRLARLYRAEAGAIALRQTHVEADCELAARLQTWSAPPMIAATGHENPPEPDRAAVNAARRQAVARAARSLPIPDTALKFARYETALQNRLDRTLSRLEDLQRRRGGEPADQPEGGS